MVPGFFCCRGLNFFKNHAEVIHYTFFKTSFIWADPKDGDPVPKVFICKIFRQ